MPAPHYSVFFTGRMPFLPPNQQRQSTEGIQSTTKGEIRVGIAGQMLTLTVRNIFLLNSNTNQK